MMLAGAKVEVKCDESTTTPEEIEKGIVNVEIIATMSEEAGK